MLREFRLPVAYQIDQRIVPGGTRGDQGAMRRMRSIIGEGPPGKVGHHAAGFVHQKVGRRKVPVVAAMRREGRAERAVGDARQPQRQ
jgi:hypothetical protein